MSASDAILRAALERDRRIVVAGLAGLCLLSWAYLVRMAGAMGGAAAEASASAPTVLPRMVVWGPWDLAATFVMWAVMMVAMMVPSVAPTVLLYATVARKRRRRADPTAATWAFLSAYLVVWTAFSAAATLLQWALHAAALLSPAMVSTSPLLGGAVLVAAGAFQWTPAKAACLRHCRSPLEFVAGQWRDGVGGAFAMGLHHGAYCLGCCWVLMLLLFVAGVMNLLWVAAIAGLVLLEKVLPRGVRFGRIAGVALVVAGVAMLAAGIGP